MALPKDPRQLMINLMYLVLTAMLALNITKEVLNAFQTINSSIEGSNGSITDKNNKFYDAFNTAEQNPSEREKVKQYNDKAKEIKAQSEQLTAYLQAWKDTVIQRSGGYEDGPNGTKQIKSLENIDASTRLFVEEKKGDEVKAKLNSFVTFLLDRVNPANRDEFKKQFPIRLEKMPTNDENPTGDWAYGTFHNIPVVATIAMLSKFQNDIKNSESMVLEHLLTQVHLEDYKFDALVPIAVTKNSYALEGQEVEATVMLAAYNKSANPTITSTAGAVQVKEGVGTLKFKASGAGLKTVNGIISIDKAGKKESYPYKFEYMVGSAGASLQLDKMNVMYIGVDNPLTLSASGYNIEDVSLSIPGADLKSTGKGTYIANVSKEGKLDWSINAKSRAGAGVTKVSGGVIRVKLIPNPQASIMGRSSGLFPTAQFKVQKGILAKVDGFDFETSFQVTKYRFTWVPKVGDPKEIEVKGAFFDGDVRNVLERVRPGDRVIMENIKAVGPDRRERSINSITFNLN
jgi:gliding motility-associated protein GldM